MKRRTKWLLFGLYALLMLWLLLGKRLFEENQVGVQLIPFVTLRRFFGVLLESGDPVLRRQAWVNLVGNVVMFVPLGFFAPWLWPYWQHFGRHFMLMTAVLLAVELTQMITGLGWFDVDDLILNLPAALLGYGLWHGFCRDKTS